MLNFSTKEKRDMDEKLYSVVVEELENGTINKALWAKALADSDSDKDKTQALYIKLRVQKLYDEMNFEKEQRVATERAKAVVENKKVKVEKTIETLSTTTQKLISMFRWLTGLMLVLGIVGLFLAYITSSVSDDWSWQVIFFSGIAFTIFGSYLSYQCFKITKITDQKLLKKKLNLFFIILIPFSAIGTIIGLVMPLIALVLFINCISLIINAVKYNHAFAYAMRNNLVE